MEQSSPDRRAASQASGVALDNGTTWSDGAFATTIRRPDPTTAVVELRGEIDIATAPQARTALFGALKGGTRRVVVDLSEVRFFAAAGLSVLIEVSVEAREREVDLVFTNPSSIVYRVVHITGCDELFDAEVARTDGAAQTPSEP